jgi:hypothetical protein
VQQFPLNGLTDFVIAATEELDQAKAMAQLEGDCSAQVRDDVDIDQQIHD